MEAWISGTVEQLPLVVLFVIIAAALAILVKGADILVDQAVSLSIRWGVPKILVGATIVSIGTTLPEAAVSVLAAVKGAPGLAIGNAVGSIIADTGLILGLAAIIGRIPVDPKIVNRQSWIQVASAILLVLVCIPYFAMRGIFSEGGRLPQLVGFGFLILLGIYIWRSITWSKLAPPDEVDDSTVTIDRDVRPVIAILELILGVALVLIGSRILIPAVEETALRLRIPDAIIAATLVAFGTSLPELVTAITAVRKGHGELALGNILGADVLNVLFVTGAAAAVTRGGLKVPPEFFYLFFPSMFFVVIVLRAGIGRTTHYFSKAFGFVLLFAYIVTVVLGYVVPG
ncbi:MAG: sodium:calcium antiporter [Spirochaetales bacterium]|jgi:cation:H+ antiporter|nr:sodium:calcium antiporter [Spirochaetales bacterium]